MSRVRLTKRYARNRKAVDIADGLFPGDVGNPERAKNYKKMDEYHTFEPSLNHWIPDMRHEWKDNPREETGHGIPKVAKIYMAAKKATKLAMMLLGDDASEEVLEKQARDFMRMGNNALSASLNRWAEEQETEAEELIDADDDLTEADAEELAIEEELTEARKKRAKRKQVEATEEVVDATEEVVDVDEDFTVEADENLEADEEVVDADDFTEADDEVVDDEIEIGIDEEIVSVDVDFNDKTVEDDEVTADDELESIFEEANSDDENDVVSEDGDVVASKKTGIKRLAGQPKLNRVARRNADELSQLWSKWDTPTIR